MASDLKDTFSMYEGRSRSNRNFAIIIVHI